MSVDELVAAAKSWRGMARLVVLVDDGAQVQEVVVKLGAGRRRWKRVAAAVEPMADQIAGARGYDGAGELVGSWDAPADDDDVQVEEDDELETDAMSGHRLHTQWVIREVSKIFEGAIRLQNEQSAAIIELLRDLKRPVVATPMMEQPVQDEASRTLGMLLQAAMSNQGRNHTDEDQRETGSPRSDATGQGQQAEPGQAGS